MAVGCRFSAAMAVACNGCQLQWLSAAQPMVSWAAGLRPEGVERWFPRLFPARAAAATARRGRAPRPLGQVQEGWRRSDACGCARGKAARGSWRAYFVDARGEKVPTSPQRGAAAWLHVLAAQSEGLNGSADVFAGERATSRDLLPPHLDHILGISVQMARIHNVHAACCREMCAMALKLEQTVQGGDVASARKCRTATSKVNATSREMQYLRESLPCGRGLLCKCRFRQLLLSSGCLSRVLGQSKQVNTGGAEPNLSSRSIVLQQYKPHSHCTTRAVHLVPCPTSVSPGS